MTAQLRPFQQEIVDAILTGKSKVIAAEQGLGKTYCAIAIADAEEAKNILVITTNSAKLAWKQEIKQRSKRRSCVVTPYNAAAVKLDPDFDGKVVWRVINYDKLSRTDNGFLQALKDVGPFDIIILDEAHLAKDIVSNRTKAIYGSNGLMHHTKRILPMSGTLAPNNAGEIWTHIRALDPQLILNSKGIPMTRIEFENRYCQVEERRIGTGRNVRLIRGSKNIPELRERLGKFIIRKTKRECLPELPDISFTTVPLEIRDMTVIDASRPYEHEPDDDVFMKTISSDEHIMKQLVQLGIAKAAAASLYLHDFLIDDPTRKIIVWFTNTAPLDYAFRQLGRFRPVRIDGRDSTTAREFAIHTFLNDNRCQIFMGNIAAAGEGITLLNEFTQPTDVFFVQSMFSPGRNAQAAARCHRIGQRSAVLVRHFIADGSWLDKRIQEILIRKENELAELI